MPVYARIFFLMSFYWFNVCLSSLALAQERDSFIPLPAIRRIGLEHVQTNISDFRSFMNRETRQLQGIVAEPLSAEELEALLLSQLAQAIRQSGRFWFLPADHTLNFLPKPTTLQSYQKTKERISLQYDLDAWISTEIFFSPDHTRLRLFLTSAKDFRYIYVREDLVFAPQPQQSELAAAFFSALSRLIKTLRHDGKITWTDKDLVVVDFGIERALAVGQRLRAGQVILSAWHPQTREFLRAKRLAYLELEVVEVREGSALCKILGRNTLTENEVERLLGKEYRNLPLLVWQALDDEKNQDWQDLAQKGGATEGFQPPFEREKLPSSPQKPEDTPPFQPPLKIPGSELKTIVVGTGWEQGVMRSKLARKSGYSYLVLNHVDFKIPVYGDSMMFVFHGDLSFYNRGFVGEKLLFGLSFFYPAIPESSFWLGANIGYGGSSVSFTEKDKRSRQRFNYPYFDLAWVWKVPRVIDDKSLEFLGGVALDELLAGRLGLWGDLSVDIASYNDTKLYMFATGRVGPGIWQSLALGLRAEFSLSML